jgi:hypothetical protein
MFPLPSKRRKRAPLSARPDRTGRRKCRLQLEALEDRTVLSAGALDPAFGLGGKVTTDFLTPMPTSPCTCG